MRTKALSYLKNVGYEMHKVCKNPACGKEYSTEDKRQKFCCKACNYACRPTNKVQKACEFCGKELFIYPSRDDGRRHFCSTECNSSWQSAFVRGENHHGWRGGKDNKTCQVCGTEFMARNKRAKFCSNECRIKDLTDRQKGKNHPKWKGGVTPYRRRVETTAVYKTWRKSVFKRDKYHCRVCGGNKKIQVHHIKTFAEHPELRMDIKNGVTLCAECHLQTYGKEDRFEQYFDFLLVKADLRGDS